MALHNELGAAGEQFAVEYLIRQGMIIRERNWKMGHLEVDIIAEKNGVLHFIEVKTRSRRGNYDPRLALNYQKRRNIQNAAIGYAKFYHCLNFGRQLDAMIIYGTPGHFEIEYLPNALMPTGIKTYR